MGKGQTGICNMYYIRITMEMKLIVGKAELTPTASALQFQLVNLEGQEQPLASKATPNMQSAH